LCESGPNARELRCRPEDPDGCPIPFMMRPVRTSPGRWGLARDLPEVLAQVGLVREAAPQRNLTQGPIGRKHVLSGQFNSTAHDEGTR